MKTKYVCHGLISLCVNFNNNRTMWSTKFLVKICRWGGKGKRADTANSSKTENVKLLAFKNSFLIGILTIT